MLTIKAKQQGFGLIEMLVAGLVITVGLIGMILLQANTQRDAFNTYRLSMAGLYAQDLQERLRANMCFLSGDDLVDNESSVNSFLTDQKVAWKEAHNLIGTDWVVNLDLESNLTPDVNDENEVERNGYWRFDLETCYAQCSSNKPKKITQRLLVEYRAGGCVDG